MTLLVCPSCGNCLLLKYTSPPKNWWELRYKWPVPRKKTYLSLNIELWALMDFETWPWGALSVTRVQPTKHMSNSSNSTPYKESWNRTKTMSKNFTYQIWLVVYLPLWKIWKSVGFTIPNIWKNRKMFQTTNTTNQQMYLKDVQISPTSRAHDHPGPYIGHSRTETYTYYIHIIYNDIQ